MKITKYVHSCLLVETPERVGIIDPGQFSWESGVFNIDKLDRLDDIVITHEHYDHMHVPFIQELVKRFPHVRIFTTNSAANQLREAGITNVFVESNNNVELFATKHESIAPLGIAPENTGVHYLKRLTHPGDSHYFTKTKEILALPVTASWSTFARAAALGSELKPKYIIPIHDWHWNETARIQAYDRLESFFKEQGIIFIKPTDGKAIEF